MLFQAYHIQTSRCIEAKQFNKKKGSPNNFKYKLPLAVRTLVIYFCWGGILIVKWKGLCDFFSQNYLRIFSLLLLSSHADVQSSRLKIFFSKFFGVSTRVVRTWIQSHKKLLLLTFFDWWVSIIQMFCDMYEHMHPIRVNQMVSKIIPADVLVCENV